MSGRATRRLAGLDRLARAAETVEVAEASSEPSGAPSVGVGGKRARISLEDDPLPASKRRKLPPGDKEIVVDAAVGRKNLASAVKALYKKPSLSATTFNGAFGSGNRVLAQRIADRLPRGLEDTPVAKSLSRAVQVWHGRYRICRYPNRTASAAARRSCALRDHAICRHCESL